MKEFNNKELDSNTLNVLKELKKVESELERLKGLTERICIVAFSAGKKEQEDKCMIIITEIENRINKIQIARLNLNYQLL